ncbi:MAG: triose-phosphate isomerase [bacterium]
MRRPVIAGNWKMFKTRAEAATLAAAVREGLGEAPLAADVVLIPPFTALEAVRATVDGGQLRLGAQDLFWEASGAWTGEVSPQMIADAGATFVLVGHSERRQHFGETNETTRRKLAAALGAGLTPILCVGETQSEREIGATNDIVERQVLDALNGRTADETRKIVVAYEPVWAIGTGRNATPYDANAVHKHIRQVIKQKFGDGVSDVVRIQYGGSVKPDTIEELLAQSDIDGALVGGASLEPEGFLKIVRAGL